MKRILAVCIAVFDFALYLSMKSIWSGIEGMFGVSWLQYVLLGLLTALMISAIVLFFARPKCSVHWWLTGLGGIFAIALFYMLSLAIGSLQYILRSFGDILFWFVVLDFAIFLIFYYPKTRLTKCWYFRSGVLAFVVILILIVTFNLKLCFITNMPVVYAVEDTYQIVWTTSANATGSVTVGEQVYTDVYAGSANSETTVHKVVVPMAVLDQAKAYEISSTQIIYRGPYSGVKGGTVSACFAFEPVDFSDGLNYYTLSDTHEYTASAIAAGSFYGDDLDFLIMAGDIASHLEEEADIAIILQIAYGITKGEHPVIYARGNHETKGEFANQLYKYVGSLNERFYYTVRMNGVFAVVLDLGEDHYDDWWEFYGTAHFADYRTEQTAFLEDAVNRYPIYEDESIKYRMAICHIPVAYVTPVPSLSYAPENMFLADIKTEWTELLNTLVIDLMVSGHHHQLMQITQDLTPNTALYFHKDYWEGNTTKAVGYRTNANFDVYTVSRRSLVQAPSTKENVFGKAFTGLATSIVSLSAETGTIWMRYTNSLKEIVAIVNPFTGIASNEIYLETTTWPLIP